ncbi:MAG: SH3 domain-containing protein [Armatimonadetes bacterium]|nr:SH3 domain-containing protein [Armatimonadota bacterium]
MPRFRKLVVAAAVGISVVLTAAACAAKGRPAWVIPNSAIVRDGPGQNHDILGSVSRGTKLTVLAFRDKWCLVKLPSGKKGWVAEWLLEFSAQKGRQLAASVSGASVSGGAGAARNSAGPQPRAAWVCVSAVNVRKGPGLGYPRYGTLTRGAKVYVVAREGQWCRCRTPGGYGWIRRDCLEFDVAAGRKLAASAGTARSSNDSSSGSNGTAKGFVAGTEVRLRAEPSRAGRTVALLDKGQTVYVVDEHKGWYRVRVHGGEAGWVHAGLVKLATESSRPSRPAVASLPKPADFPSPRVQPAYLHDEATGKAMSVEAFVAADGVNVRRAPSLGASIKGSLPKGTRVVVKGVHGQWAFVRLPDGGDGWIAGWMLNYCSPEQCSVTDESGKTFPVRVGWVARPEVNLRAGPGLDYPELTEAAFGATFIVLERKDQWYRAAFGDGSVAWVASWLVDTREQRLARAARMAMIASARVAESSMLGAAIGMAADLGNKIVELATRYLGYPYVRGGESPSGFDCSGFVRYVHRQFGIDVSHDSRQLFTQGRPVAREDLQPGDVVFFRDTYRPGISHVGIYIGNDQFIHASTRRTGVRISSLNKPFYAARYAGARRMHE